MSSKDNIEVTLNKNKDFKRLYRLGKSYVSPYLVTYILKNKKTFTRFGVTTSKKIGNAVLRNRSRRIIMVAAKSLLPFVRGGYDFVFVARGKTPYVKSTDILRHMKAHLKKANVFNKDVE